MKPLRIDVDKFVREHQDEITTLINIALNKAGEKVQQKISAGELGTTLQEVLPLLLYEVLSTSTVSTLRLVSEMINEAGETQPQG